MPSAIIKTILAEAAGEDEEGMVAVASTIVNRSRRRHLTPEQVVNQPNQFTGRWRTDLDRFVARQPSETVQMAERAWQRAQHHPIPGIDHYLTNDLARSPSRPGWAASMGGQRIIGHHTFFDSATTTQGGSMLPQAQSPQSSLPVEEQLYRVDRLVQASGMRPLSAEELRQLYQQMTQRPSPQAPGQPPASQGMLLPSQGA